MAENGRTVLVQGNRYKVLSAGNDIDGNVNSVVYAEGKLYFATSKGVYFMNGLSSRRYALSGTPSDYLYRDSKGRVWSFPNSNSVEVFDGRSGKMSSLASVKQTSRNKMKNPQLIYENAYGQIIVKPQQGELSFYSEYMQGRYSPHTFDDVQLNYRTGGLDIFGRAQFTQDGT